MTRLATPIFDNAHLKFLNQFLIYVNLYEHAKKLGYFIDLFWIYG